MEKGKENMAPHISVVSPVYKAENIVAELVRQLHESLAAITDSYEIILVNDTSPDSSWETIVVECEKDSRVKGIDLSRNFGQHYAITAGLSFAKGEWVVIMDCDLQDRPEEIPNLYRKAQEGWDSVFAQRANRRDPFFKRQFSKLFYKFFSYLTDTKQDPTIANFGIYNKKVIGAILEMKDYVRFFPTMAQWVGFRKFYLPVQHAERHDGKSSYNFKGLMKLAWNNIIAFSDKPLRLIVKIGFSISFVSSLMIIIYLIGYLKGSIQVLGFTTLILSFWFLSGAIIFILGIIGLYVGKTFENVKKRPVFVIREQKNV
jgi:dolichol-phosphate mannosyltransferase